VLPDVEIERLTDYAGKALFAPLRSKLEQLRSVDVIDLYGRPHVAKSTCMCMHL
jgi:hypothetical protein